MQLNLIPFSLLSFPIRRPKFLLALVLFLTGFFALHARHITFDSAIENLLPHDTPAQRYYADIRRQFGSEEVGVVGLIADTIYTPVVLQKIARIMDALQRITGVKHVVSLTNAVDFVTSVRDEDTLLVPQVPTTQKGWRALKQRIHTTPLYHKSLVSPDGRATAISIFFFDNLSDEEFTSLGIDAAIQAIVDQEQGPEQLFYTGLPHLKSYAKTAMQQDLIRLLPLAGLCMSVLLFICFRSWRGVLLPLLVISVGMIWTLGIMVLTGSRLNLGTTALPPFVLVIGTTYALRVMASYYEHASCSQSATEVVQTMLNEIGPPLCITALTTAVGFLALSVHQIVSIRELGVYTASGILIVVVLSLVLIPALLTLLPLPQTQDSASFSLHNRLQDLLVFTQRNHRTVLMGSLFVLSLAIWQATTITVDSNFQAFFPETAPARQDLMRLNRHLVGSSMIYVVIEGHGQDSLKTPAALMQIHTLQEVIDTLPGVDKTISFLDYGQLFDRGLHATSAEQGASFWTDPARLRGVMQLAFFNAAALTRVIDHPHYARTTIQVFSSLLKSSDMLTLEERIHAYAHTHISEDITVRVTGALVLHASTTRTIVWGQMQSLALAAGLIGLLFIFLFRSIKIGLILILPNVFPILVLFGLMGVSGTILSPSTSVIAALALGLAVDDTVHFMTRFRAVARTLPDQAQVLSYAMLMVGRPICYTSFILGVGLLTLRASSFVPIQQLGVLAASTMLVALIADLVLLPALIVALRMR